MQFTSSILIIAQEFYKKKNLKARTPKTFGFLENQIARKAASIFCKRKKNGDIIS